MKKVVVFLPIVTMSNAANAYPMVNDIGETCESSGYAKFQSKEECFAAAEAMGLEPRFSTSNVPRPLGCYRKGTRVYYGLSPNTGGAQADRIPLCKMQEPEYPWIFENGETCGTSGFTFLSEAECWAAGEAQGLEQGWSTSNPNRPQGCYRKGYKVFYGLPSVNAGNGAQAENGRHPVCGSAPSEVPETPEFEVVSVGHCDGEIVYTDDSSAISKLDQCAMKCKALGTPFFSSTIAGQPSCRCCDATMQSGAGGWFQYQFVVEEPEVPEFAAVSAGVCDGEIVYTDDSSLISKRDQCAIECKAMGKAFFASTNAGQPSCRCCDETKQSGAGGWTQYSLVPANTYADNGVCNGSIASTDSESAVSNRDQCAIACKAQGTPVFASVTEGGGQPACRCCDEVNPQSGAGGWSQFTFNDEFSLAPPLRRTEDEDHDDDSEEDTINLDDE